MLHQRTAPLARSWGLCRYCLRNMWDGDKIPEGATRVSADRIKCATCARWIERKGTDPRDSKTSPAERLPVERAEPDDGWKVSPERGCADLPVSDFEPELDKDDPEYVRLTDAARDRLWAGRRMIAQTLCADCPFRTQCRSTAKAMGYEGLWGAAWFTRTRWQDLITKESGPTMYAVARDRRKGEDMQRKAAAA